MSSLHPERAAEVYAESDRTLLIALPDLGDPAAQVRIEALIQRLAANVVESFLDEARSRQAGRAA